MAASATVKAVLVAATGVPASVIEQLDRRVRSAGLLRNQQGRFGSPYTALELAYLTVGLMFVSDGISRSGTSVVRELPAIKKLNEEGIAFFQYSVGGQVTARHELNRRTVGTFVEAVAKELTRRSENPDPARDCVIGLTFAADMVCGWLDQRPVNEDDPTIRTRHSFGNWEGIRKAGFQREARLELSALLQIAALLKPSTDEEA